MRFRRIGRRFAASVAAWFQALTVLGKIGVIVASIHLIFAAALAIHHLASSAKMAAKPIAVRVHCPPKIKPPSTQKQTAPPASRPPPKAAKTLPKKPTPKPAQKKPPAPAPAPPAPKQKPVPEIKLPAFLEKSPLKPAMEPDVNAPSFGRSLAAILQEELELPEIGEVEVRITVASPGKISKVEILGARSQKNAEWLKNQLPRLCVPCFNDFGISDAELEFTITFRNVEKI